MNSKNNPWLNQTLNEAQDIVNELRSTIIKQSPNDIKTEKSSNNENEYLNKSNKYTYFTINYLDKNFIKSFKKNAKKQNLSYAKFFVKIFDEYIKNNS